MAIGVGWVLDPIISFLELVAAAIILGGGAWALTTLLRHRDAEQARHEFSRALLLGLDFTIGADMLKLAVAPDLSAAALATGVTGVRIALTVTLLREQRETKMNNLRSMQNR